MTEYPPSFTKTEHANRHEWWPDVVKEKNSFYKQDLTSGVYANPNSIIISSPLETKSINNYNIRGYDPYSSDFSFNNPYINHVYVGSPSPPTLEPGELGPTTMINPLSSIVRASTAFEIYNKIFRYFA